MVGALDQVGLGALAPAMLAGNGLVRGSPRQLAEKDDICEGAVPREHSHFFTETGLFGSVDYNDQQVDDGEYEVVDDDTVLIGGGPSGFTYRITEDGQTLSLDPVIPASDKRLALARPLEFSGAGWSVAVAFPGYTWERGLRRVVLTEPIRLSAEACPISASFRFILVRADQRTADTSPTIRDFGDIRRR